MTTTNKSHDKQTNHKQLNSLQTEVLLALYKFRFATADLIADYQQQIVRYSNARLKILLEQEFIGRNYDSSYRIKQRPATYFLLPKAVRFLKAYQELDLKGLHLSYYSRKANPDFIKHWLRVFRIYLMLDDTFGDNLELFTCAEIAEQDIYPKLRPDAFLQFAGSKIPNCMLDVVESNKPPSQIRRHVSRYFSHYENDTTWGREYPHILLVCDNVGLERELQRIIARTLNIKGLSKPYYFTTTLKALYGLHDTSDQIWTNALDPVEILALTNLN